MSEERLHKVLAHAGISSRRKAESIIADGRVTVNGRVVREMGVKVDPAHDTVAVDGVRVEFGPREYWLVNKPEGVITTVHDPWGRPTARDLVPSQARLFPVGRLDVDSSGLLFFTNDGDLAHRLTHPRFEHDKSYRVLVAGRPSEQVLGDLRSGIVLDGRRTAPAEVTVLEAAEESTWLAIVLREGRKRQIRRMLAEVGHPVLRLVRVRIGPLELGDLGPGQARRLTPEERLAVKAYVASVPAGGADTERATSRPSDARQPPSDARQPVTGQI